MNDQTTKLIEQLAQKLGTTAEYLWTILIKQAAISAWVDMIYFVMIIIMGVILFKTHKYLSKETSTNYSVYESDAGLIVVPVMIVLTITWIVIFIVCFFSLGNVFNGVFNPEYWALQEVLNAIK